MPCDFNLRLIGRLIFFHRRLFNGGCSMPGVRRFCPLLSDGLSDCTMSTMSVLHHWNCTIADLHTAGLTHCRSAHRSYAAAVAQLLVLLWYCSAIALLLRPHNGEIALAIWWSVLSCYRIPLCDQMCERKSRPVRRFTVETANRTIEMVKRGLKRRLNR